MVTVVPLIWIVPPMKAVVTVRVIRTSFVWDTVVFPVLTVVSMEVAVLLIPRLCPAESVEKIVFLITATVTLIVVVICIVVEIYVHRKTATENLAILTLIVGTTQICFAISKFVHGRRTVKTVRNSQ